jgi:hypothetical protein
MGTPISVTGVLTVLYADDFANQRSERIHTIRDERRGNTFTLRFEGAPPEQLRSGMRVTARGRALQSEIYLAAADATSLTVQSTGFTSATAVSGDQKTLVMVANFTDKLLDPLVAGADCSIDAIGDRMFTDPFGQSVDAMYRDTSFGAVSFSGKVVGPFTLPASSIDSCDISTWASAADAQALASGVDPAAYARRVYMFPSSTCPYAGIAELGMTPSRAWVFACDRPHVYAHELGHNLGLQHASTDASEYGDDSDVMGMLGGIKPFNAPHKWQAGWLPDSKTAAVTASGTYSVSALPLDPTVASGAQLLKVSKPDTADSYYISYRHGSGFEANACCGYLDRTNIHRWAGGVSKTYFLAALGDGESYVDPANGFTVTQVSHGDASATVTVKPGTGCGAAAPTLTLTPKDQGAPPGTQLVFDGALQNNDGSGCPASSFTVARTAPTGWTTSLSATTLEVAPGSIGYVTLAVTSPNNAALGSYPINVSAMDSNNVVHAGSTSGTYEVLGGDTVAPSAPTSLAARLKGKQVTLSWGAATDNVAVAGYRVSRNGVTLGRTTVLTWSDSVSPGSYTYSVTAYDAAGNVSPASNSVTVSVSGGAKGK